MAKVKLLKDHNGQVAGTVGEVSEGRANYLVRTKVAEYVEETESEKKVKASTKKQTKNIGPCKSC